MTSPVLSRWPSEVDGYAMTLSQLYVPRRCLFALTTAQDFWLVAVYRY